MNVGRRVLANTAITYLAAAFVTFVFVLAKEVVEPSPWNPYLGQAVGNTFFITCELLVGLPLVIGGWALLDWLLRGSRHPRGIVAAMGLIPASFWLLAVSQGLIALGYSAWSLAVAALVACFMRVPSAGTEDTVEPDGGPIAPQESSVA